MKCFEFYELKEEVEHLEKTEQSNMNDIERLTQLLLEKEQGIMKARHEKSSKEAISERQSIEITRDKELRFDDREKNECMDSLTEKLKAACLKRMNLQVDLNFLQKNLDLIRKRSKSLSALRDSLLLELKEYENIKLGNERLLDDLTNMRRMTLNFLCLTYF
jgi:hypothetical protein